MPDPVDLSTVEISHFEPLLNEKFSALPWDGPGSAVPVELELVRAFLFPLGGPEGRRAPFSLFFNGPAGELLAQGTYVLTHPRTGELTLFLVPVARKDDSTQLQAVLN